MHSFATDPHAVTVERLNDHFTKFLLKDGVVLHRFTAAHDLHFHSHPFNMWSDVLTTGYWEEVIVKQPGGLYTIERFERHPGTSHHIERGTIHRIGGFLDPEAPECWTLIHPYGEPLPWHFYRLDECGTLWRNKPGQPSVWQAA
jgi:hypothetical protein